jgi:MoaA/NifB/PqqE/SkfB family radical SAM enzyme
LEINKYQVMQLDITNYCNIRCRFCINDWSKADKKCDMDSATFDKAMSLLPLVDRGFLSCSFEPTLHPQFAEFYCRVPGTRAYTFFTTNLVRRLGISEIRDLSNSNLDSINISITSFKPEVYEYLQAGAKFDDFIRNLENVTRIFRNKENAPALRYITVVLKQNIDELPDIAKICHEKYLSKLNQFRTVFPFTPKLQIAGWLRNSITTEKQWKKAVKKLKTLPYTMGYFNPLFAKADQYTREKSVNEVNSYFQFRADGQIIMHEKNKDLLPDRFKKDFNINGISNPYQYFKKGLEEIRKMEA